MSCPGCGGGKVFVGALVLGFACIFGVLFTHIYFVLNQDDASGFDRKISHPLDNIGPFPSSANDRIFWFIQLTDIHISLYRGLPERLDHFRTFLKEHVKIIQPDLLLLTGDLTHAKDISHQGSEQKEDEWLMYEKAIKDSNLLNNTILLDIRGNHDAFNVPNLNHKSNLYAKFSVSGKKHLRSYLHILRKPYGKYSFIGVDACPDPGLKTPFNFFGLLDEKEWNRLDHLKTDSRNSNATVWFGHYPSSVVISSNMRQFKTLIGDGSVYLCGHLHTLFNSVPQLYAMQNSGTLELELGDWMANRLFRIMAIDHDIISFSDEKFQQWPAVVITNPVNAAFVMPKHEPIGRIKHSTHIRILAFSSHPIVAVKVSIDGVELGRARSVGNSLYVLPWQPQQYDRLHKIKVDVVDAAANERQVEQVFTLDPALKPGFPLIPRFLLLSNISTFLTLLFTSVWLLATVPLISLHIVYGRVLHGPVQCGGPLVNFARRWYHHYLVLCRTKTLFYPIILFNFYLALGPWFVCWVLDEYIGVSFVYGVFVMGQFMLMPNTLVQGIIQMLTFNIPLVASLAATVDPNSALTSASMKVSVSNGVHSNTAYDQRRGMVNRIRGIMSFISYDNVSFSIIIGCQLVKIVFIFLSFGWLATALSPMVLWPLVFAFAMRRRARIVQRLLSGR